MQVVLDELLDIAVRAAAKAAAIHFAALRDAIRVDTKASLTDLVTEVDRESERALVAEISRARPHDAILGEEGTAVEGTSGVRWILDPLDGTTNFIHRYPAHAVAVGIQLGGRRAIGVVHDTAHDCVYTGIVGRGAQRDGEAITPRGETALSRALIGTGFLPDAEVRRQQATVLRRILPAVRDLRRSGCPALDLCAVGAGTLDAYFECGLGPWDIAAGAAIAEAAGAVVVERPGGVLPSPLVVAGNAALVDRLSALLAEAAIIGGTNENPGAVRDAAVNGGS